MHIGQEQQILVEVGELQFCIDLDEVLSIITPPKMVRLPSARGAFIRAFKYQDELGAAVSMRITFEMEEREEMSSGQVLLGRINGRLAGFWFDRVVSILKLGDDLQAYDGYSRLQLPSPEIDALFIYRNTLIPHITLNGLIRFKQAAAWKQWLASEKPRLELQLQEAQAEAQAQQEPEAPHIPGRYESRSSVAEAVPAPLELEEFYALMDEAGLGGGDVPESVAQESDDAGVESQVVEPGEQAQPSMEEVQQPGVAAQEPEAEEESSYPLAVPVEPEESEKDYHQLIQEQEQAAESTEAPSEPREDALFALERKSEAYREKMDEGQDVDLREFQIIKVGDKGWIRRLRRIIRRSLQTVLLLCVAALAWDGYLYVAQQGNPLPRVLVKDASGAMDWPASLKAGAAEGRRFGHYSLEQWQRLSQRWKK